MQVRCLHGTGCNIETWCQQQKIIFPSAAKLEADVTRDDRVGAKGVDCSAFCYQKNSCKRLYLLRCSHILLKFYFATSAGAFSSPAVYCMGWDHSQWLAQPLGVSGRNRRATRHRRQGRAVRRRQDGLRHRGRCGNHRLGDHAPACCPRWCASGRAGRLQHQSCGWKACCDRRACPSARFHAEAARRC